MNTERLFIDTSAFYALEDASDAHHDEALAVQRWCLWRRPLLFTSQHVLDEAVTLIGGRLSPDRAVRFAESLLGSRVIQIVRTDALVERAALHRDAQRIRFELPFFFREAARVGAAHRSRNPSTSPG